VPRGRRGIQGSLEVYRSFPLSVGCVPTQYGEHPPNAKDAIHGYRRNNHPPTLENRIAALLHAHGIDMERGEYVVRQARYMRRLARLGYGPETLEATPAFLDRQPELLLDDAFGPAVHQP
jgi:hypothetical protein